MIDMLNYIIFVNKTLNDEKKYFRKAFCKHW